MRIDVEPSELKSTLFLSKMAAVVTMVSIMTSVTRVFRRLQLLVHSFYEKNGGNIQIESSNCMHDILLQLIDRTQRTYS